MKFTEKGDFEDRKRWEVDDFVFAQFCPLLLLEGSVSHQMYPYVVLACDVVFISLLPWA